MSDPFEVLRTPIESIDPDPLFTAHLRARLARALSLPQGVTVSDLALDPSPTSSAAPAGTGATSLVPYLIVSDARRALAWYADALGGQVQGEPIVMADGRIGHAEVRLGGAAMYLADESPQSEVAAPQPGSGAAISLTLEVADVDELTERAVQHGARVERPPADYPHGRNAVLWDPFGHRWIVSAPAGAPDGPPRFVPAPGDVAYVSLWVPDGARAANFFGRVLDWTVDPAPEDAGYARPVRGQSLPHGILGGHQQSTLFLCYAVASVDEAVERVRRAGGTAGEPVEQPFGRVADCTDNQGVP
ncbi:MAG TPA: VOC family protein, partial [Acidimicrobiales bacterium]|nr:VOC family protein [Acidimicrobiales bacterium]